jgi:hypothetical protein
MAYRYHGRATVNTSSPKAFGICDRCGILYNLRQLRWQFDFAGPVLQNLRLLVCDHCYDKPQEQNKPVLVPPDPLPVPNARPQNYAAAETGTTEELWAQINTPLVSITDFYLDLYYQDVSVLADITGSGTRTNFASSMSSPVADLATNDEIITFTDFTEASTNIDEIKVFDSATGGTELMSAMLPTPITAVLYNGLIFPIGNLLVRLNVTP